MLVKGPEGYNRNTTTRFQALYGGDTECLDGTTWFAEEIEICRAEERSWSERKRQ